MTATSPETKPRKGRRLAWFVAIYLASVAAVAAIVYGLKDLFGLLFT